MCPVSAAQTSLCRRLDSAAKVSATSTVGDLSDDIVADENTEHDVIPENITSAAPKTTVLRLCAISMVCYVRQDRSFIVSARAISQ